MISMPVTKASLGGVEDAPIDVVGGATPSTVELDSDVAEVATAVVAGTVVVVES